MSEIERLYATTNHFDLFALPVRFTLDRPLLEAKYLELARVAHPDLVGTDPILQVKALELSSRINDAYAVLSDDLRRAEHLLNLQGADDPFRRLPPETLDRIFDLREALSTAQSSEDEAGRDEILQSARQWYDQLMNALRAKLDAGDTGPETRDLVNTARYVQKILQS